MKRMILRVVVMLVTFVFGVVAYQLIIERASNNAPPVLKDEAVNSVPVAPVVAVAAPLPEATPKAHYIRDYDPVLFKPNGVYYLIEPRPKEFTNIETLEIGLYGGGAEPGYIRIFTHSISISDDASALFVLITKDRLVFATSPTRESEVEYRFEGDFLRTNFHSVAGKNTPVLRGVLTRSKNGRKLTEATVSFRFEYLGC